MYRKIGLGFIFVFIFIFGMQEKAFVQNKIEEESDESFFESLQDEHLYDSEIQNDFVYVILKNLYDLNPHTASYNTEIQLLTALYEGLFTYDPITSQPKKALAKSYKISRDGKRWTFYLRDDAYFSDGSRITAQSIKDSWLMLLNNKKASYSSFFDIVTGAKDFRLGTGKKEDIAINVIDDFTISVKLETPSSHFPNILCMAGFAVVKNDLSVFSGPFVLKEMYPGEKIIFEKNQKYYDANKVPLKKITVLQIDDEKENTYLMNMRAANWVNSAIKAEKLLIKDCVHVNAQYGTEYLFFKNKENSIWNNVDFRLALLEAVPWNEIRGNGNYVDAKTFVYPLAGYPKVKGYESTDEIEAKFLMDEARKKYNISMEDKLELRFFIKSGERHKNFANILKKAWEPLGVNLVTEEVDDFDYLQNIENTDADLYYYSWIGDFSDPLAFLELFRSASSLNSSGWANAEFDSLLAKASLYSNEERFKILAQAEQILLDSGEILPITHPITFNVIDLNQVGGWYINSFDIHPFKYLYLKPVKDNIKNVV